MPLMEYTCQWMFCGRPGFGNHRNVLHAIITVDCWLSFLDRCWVSFLQLFDRFLSPQSPLFTIPVHLSEPPLAPAPIPLVSPWTLMYLAVALPDEVKLKKYVKGLAKEAAANCALRHRERRSYAREQVKGLSGLLRSEPGMLGPKLPMVGIAVAVFVFF